MRAPVLVIVVVAFLLGVGATLLFVRGGKGAEVVTTGIEVAETGESPTTGPVERDPSLLAPTAREVVASKTAEPSEPTPPAIDGIEGDVKDTDGAPIEGALIFGDRRIHLPVTSDSQGRFRLPVDADAWPSKVYCKHGDYRTGSADVPPREQYTAGDIHLVLPSGGGLCVQVLGPYGSPIEGAILSLGLEGQARPGLLVGNEQEKRIYDRILLTQGVDVRSGRTDEEGSGCLRGLAGGPSWLEVVAEGFPVWRPEDPIEIPGDGEHASITVTLHEGWSLAGHVRDPAGSPIEEAKVEGVFAVQFQADQSGTDGSFYLEGFPGEPSPGELRVSHPDFASYWAQVDDATGDLQVVLQPPRSLELQLQEADSAAVTGEARIRLNAEPGRALQYPGPHHLRLEIREGVLLLENLHTQVDSVALEVEGYAQVELVTAAAWSGLRSETVTLERTKQELQVRLFHAGGEPYPKPVSVTLTASRTDEVGRLIVGTKTLDLQPDSEGVAWISGSMIDPSGDLTIFAKAPGLKSQVVQLVFGGAGEFPDRCQLTLSQL